MNSNPIRRRVRLWGCLSAVTLLAAVSGCSADETATASSSSGSWMQGEQDNDGATKNGQSGGGADAGASSADAGGANPGVPTGGGGMATGDSQGIGLKPGGAQDIAFFRQKIASAMLPKPGDMTIEGWLNEHDTVLPKALKDRVVSLHALAGIIQAPDAPAGKTPDAVVQIGLNSGKSLQDVQTTLALTVVIDRSGSMSGDKLVYVKAGLHALADQLPKGTRLGLIIFSTDVQTVFPAAVVDGSNITQLHDAIDAVTANGGTNLHGGLKAGMETCQGTPAGFEQRRVMLLSDGQPTAGDTSASHIFELASAAAALGCSVSSVGVGLDFSPSLMNGIAQKGNGTAWFLQNAEHAKSVFVQDLETMLLPVAEKLTLQFKFAAGWKVEEIYGFDWVEKDGTVQITGPKKAPAQPGEPVDPPPVVTDPGDPVAMPTLFASKRNGLVMARLTAPAGVTADQMLDLTLATVEYGYTLSKGGAAEKFEVPVKVPGLAPMPDGGLAYFTDPAVHRAWLLLSDGQALIQAVALADKGLVQEAKAALAVAKAVHAAHMKLLSADLVTFDASVPNLDDAEDLIDGLDGLLKP